MKALALWAVILFSPQGEVVQSVHLTRAECQASIILLVATGPTIRSGITAPPDPKFRPGVGAPPEAKFGDIEGSSHEAKCVQFRAER